MSEKQSDYIRDVELSIVMPCLNEADTLAVCISKAKKYLHDNEIQGEIIVADNGSIDGSQEIATQEGARLIHADIKGYGSAIMEGIYASRGEFIIVGDADDSYDFTALEPFVTKLHEGYDLVVGNRFRGGIKPGAMPNLHKYLGNPILSWIGRLFFNSPCGDFHCGLRGFRKEAILKLNLKTTGMEFASEMLVKATLFQMRICEVPTILYPDGRSHKPHLRTWRDGWQHLRFLLLYSPRWLFLYPSTILILIGLITGMWLIPSPRTIGSITFDVHTLLYSGLFVIIGFQGILFAVFSKIYAITTGLHPEDPTLDYLFRFINLEVGLSVGAILVIFGLAGSIYVLSSWGNRSFGPMDPTKTLRLVIPAIFSLALGCQIILSSFFLSLLGLRRK